MRISHFDWRSGIADRYEGKGGGDGTTDLPVVSCGSGDRCLAILALEGVRLLGSYPQPFFSSFFGGLNMERLVRPSSVQGGATFACRFEMR